MRARPGERKPRIEAVRRFASDRRGSIAPLFAAIIIPIIIAAGIGLDIARQVSAQNKLQDALDATGLALAHLPANTPAATVQADAQQWVQANLPSPNNISNLVVQATPATGQITVSATGQVPTTLMALAGFKQMPVQAQSTIRWAPNRLEVALVLDNTGSMNTNNKIQTLITASQQLVKTLFGQANGDPNAIRISVVPFSMTVNVGPQYQNATWMTGVLPAAYKTALDAAYPNLDWSTGTDIFTGANVNRFTLFSQLGTTWAGCVEMRPAPYDVQETAPDPNNPATLFVPFFAPDEPDDTYYGYPAYPNSYLSDRTTGTWVTKQSNSTKYNTTNWTHGAQPYPYTGNNYQLGPNSGCALIPLLRLTNDQTAVQNEISQMVAIGDTNLAMGMMWGWHTLSPLGPFGDGVPYTTANAKKVIVFLTDGWNQSTTSPSYDNNNSYYSGLGYAWQNRAGFGANTTMTERETALDARTALVCKNIQAAGITIYAVRIDVTNGQSSAVLQNCASKPSYFFDVPNPADLNAAFSTIAGSIGQLRVAQ